MFKLKHTLIILALLFLPLMLRLAAGSTFEPFPAVMLPSGASRVPVDTYRAGYVELYGQQEKDSSWKKIDSRQLLNPIPKRYHSRIISENMGIQKPDPQSRLERLLIKYGIIKKRTYNEQEKQTTKKWLKAKLKKQGFSVPVLKIVKREKLISIKNEEVLDENKLNEKIILLY